ncbi:MAG TPA: phosphorylated adapter RNA export RNA-binding domain-containing protein, partial [Polyangiaceae bacterium]
IAKALGESDEVPLFQIAGVVRVLGEETSLKILAETQETEKNGGMMLPDGSRKRTPGGVFFFLARQKLSQADKIAIFRPPKEPKAPPSSPGGENRFPRRRVIEVAPARPAAPARTPRAGFVPPELPLAVRKVKAREHALAAVAGLPQEEQYAVLVELLAELHEKLGYRAPESQRTPFDPPTRPGVATAGPPSSQRPIPVPESSRLVGEGADSPTGSDSDKPKRRAGSKRS